MFQNTAKGHQWPQSQMYVFYRVICMYIFYRKSDFARLPVAGKSRHSHRHQQCPLLCLTIQYLCNWKHGAGHAYHRWGSAVGKTALPNKDADQHWEWGASESQAPQTEQLQPVQPKLNGITRGSVGTLSWHDLYEGQKEEDPRGWWVRFHPPGRAEWKQEDERGWNPMSGYPQASQVMSQDSWARKPWQNQKGMSFFVNFFNAPACLFPSLLWSSVSSINILVKTPLPCGCPRKRSFSLAWTRALEGSDVPLLGDQYGCDTS